MHPRSSGEDRWSIWRRLMDDLIRHSRWGENLQKPGSAYSKHYKRHVKHSLEGMLYFFYFQTRGRTKPRRLNCALHKNVFYWRLGPYDTIMTIICRQSNDQCPSDLCLLIINIARIANAVQVTICLLVSTSVY